jgi:hypothetical protein
MPREKPILAAIEKRGRGVESEHSRSGLVDHPVEVLKSDEENRRTKPTSTKLCQPIHRHRGLVRPVIPQDDSENRVLLPVSDRVLVHHSTHDLRVDDHQIPIVRAHIQREPILSPRHLHRPALRLKVDLDLALLVWPHQAVEDLLPRPELDGLPDRRRGDVDLELGVGEVGAVLGELGAGVELVLAREEEGGGDEVLDGGDDGLAVSGSNDVLLGRHELQGFRSGFFRLGDVWRTGRKGAGRQEELVRNCTSEYLARRSGAYEGSSRLHQNRR